MKMIVVDYRRGTEVVDKVKYLTMDYDLDEVRVEVAEYLAEHGSIEYAAIDTGNDIEIVWGPAGLDEDEDVTQ